MNVNSSTAYNSNGNRQGDFQSSQPLKAVRSIRQVISKIHVIVGGALFGAGMIVFVLHFFFDHYAAVLSLQITGGSLALSGAIELIIAAFFRRSARREQDKLARLKAEGSCFPAEITGIMSHLGVRVGRSFSVYAECSYKNHEGNTCLVKSKAFLRSPKDKNYSAWVYVNPRDPFDYAVEIFTQTAQARTNYDYR